MKVWKDVLGFEGYYQVSKDGDIKSLPRPQTSFHNGVTYWRKEKILKNPKNFDYHGVVLKSPTARQVTKAHRLVATAFIPNPENKPFINHKNGIRHDNRVENLEWCDQSQNVQHAHDTGLIKIKGVSRGDSHPCSTITEAVVRLIKLDLPTMRNIDIAKKHQVKQERVYEIRAGLTWKHVKV